ncbi:MAG TPA: crossover junction endodeoxyribonuclease RuvC [Dehalococcoidia bacterium]|nr:crossover junction endodeoxyribonuclease RuvC [Dehalococcoidia bacterium]
MSARRRVLGVDPGLTITGFGIVDAAPAGREATVAAMGTIRPKAKRSRAERLAEIADGIHDLIEEHEPDEVAIEQQFVAQNVRSALAIGEARAAVMVAAASNGIPVYEYAPTAIKETVAGYGGAPKEQVQQMVMAQLSLKEEPSPLDVSDALAIALTRCAEAHLEELIAR